VSHLRLGYFKEVSAQRKHELLPLLCGAGVEDSLAEVVAVGVAHEQAEVIFNFVDYYVQISDAEVGLLQQTLQLEGALVRLGQFGYSADHLLQAALRIAALAVGALGLARSEEVLFLMRGVGLGLPLLEEGRGGLLGRQFRHRVEALVRLEPGAIAVLAQLLLPHRRPAHVLRHEAHGVRRYRLSHV